MTELFLSIVNMSISASWIVLAVLFLRLILKKAPKWIIVLLWGIVAIRLICPIFIESVVSLIPSTETVSPEIMLEQTPEIHSGVTMINSVVNPMIAHSFTPDPATSANPLQLWIPAFALIWIIGMIGMVLHAAISYFRLKRKIGTAILLQKNIYQSERVSSPFVLGIIKPKIYLPFHINSKDMEHVIAHEEAHIRRKDHLWKPLGFLILALHWFNPLLWLGYILLCRDIEIACDEKVIKTLGTDQKADYSQALLSCSINRRIITACPLAFGEVGVKSRVKSVLNYKKPAFWIVLVAALSCVLLAVCFLTNPESKINDELSVFLDTQIADHHSDYNYSHGYHNDNFIAVSQKVLDVEKVSDKTIVYLWAMYHEYSFNDGVITLENAAHIPTVITAKREGKHGHYTLLEYWEPHDGSLYEDDIKGKFPAHLHDKALDPQRYAKEQEAFCHNAAKEYFSSISDTCGSDAPTSVITTADVEKLKTKFPGYFDLPCENGLEVYIWQMSGKTYSCGLLPKKEVSYTKEELWDLHKSSATLEQMRVIVASYLPDVTRSDVKIIPIQMPHSSYAYQIDKNYQNKIEKLFWTDFPIVEATSFQGFIDTATFDIDGDGINEECALRYGPTSGIFTFVFTASEKGKAEYANTFSCSFPDLHFEKNTEGKMMLAGRKGDTLSYAEMGVENGNIVIKSDDIDVFYWGEQGESTKINTAISNVLKEKYRSTTPDGLVHIETFFLLANEAKSGTPLLGNKGHMEEVTVYLIVYHMKYKIEETVEEVEGDFVPTAITFSVDKDNNYTLKDYWTPRSGAFYQKDIRTKFPEEAVEDALNIEKYAEILTNESFRQATAYFNSLQKDQ